VKSASANAVPSDMHEFHSNEAARTTKNVIDMFEMDAGNAELSHDLQTTFKQNTRDREPPEPAEKRLTLNSPETNVPLHSSRSVDELNVAHDEITGKSGHPSRSRPRSVLAQPDELVFNEEVKTTPTRPSLSRDVGAAASRRLLPAVPSSVYTRSQSAGQSSDDEFSNSQSSHGFRGSSWRTLSQDVNATPSRTATRLRPAASFDSVPKLLVTRRRLYTQYLITV